MEKTAFVYGSDTGTTQEIGEKLQTLLGNELELIDVANTSVDQINTYTNIIFASSTWGSGDLQSDWEDFESNLNQINFDNKIVALLGLGDQEGYSDTFSDAIGLIYEHIKDKAHIIGQTSTEGYNYETSQAEVVSGEFVGLVIDEDNQDDLTDERLKAWAQALKEGFK